MEIEFTRYKIHLSQVYNAAVFSIVAELLKNEIKPTRKSKKAFRKLFELSFDGHVCG